MSIYTEIILGEFERHRDTEHELCSAMEAIEQCIYQREPLPDELLPYVLAATEACKKEDGNRSRKYTTELRREHLVSEVRFAWRIGKWEDRRKDVGGGPEDIDDVCKRVGERHCVSGKTWQNIKKPLS